MYMAIWPLIYSKDEFMYKIFFADDTHSVIQEAERELALVSSERDKALQDLRDALANHAKELAER